MKTAWLRGFLTLGDRSVEFLAQIHLVDVRKEVRRRGIGKGLVRRALEHARGGWQRKGEAVHRPWNIATRKVHVKLGFILEACLRGVT